MSVIFKIQGGAIHLIVLVVVFLLVVTSITLLATDTDLRETRPFEFVHSLISTPCSEINCPKNRRHIEWKTPQVELTADKFDLKIKGKKTKTQRFKADTQALSVHSDPGNPSYTTLEVEWTEKGVPMRLYMYFASDGKRWRVTEVRTYNGQNPGNWLYYDGFGGKRLGKPLREDDFELKSKKDQSQLRGEIEFDDLRLLPFPDQATSSADRDKDDEDDEDDDRDRD